MKVICAPDSFKESLSASEAAHAMAAGVRAAEPDAEVDLCPIADGGEGTVDALLTATDGEARTTEVIGPLGDPVIARWGLLGQRRNEPVTAVIEMAAASGMALIEPNRRDPTVTSTYGTGQLIHAALDAKARRIVLGIGGSATNDGGCGAVGALGGRFIGHGGDSMDLPITGGELHAIHRIDLDGLDERLSQTEIMIACDVTNPLTGPNGAAHIYGPQKGASPDQVLNLDDGLKHLVAVMRRQLGRDVEFMPGAGAAGGMGAGMVAFLAAELKPGVEMVLKAVGFDNRVQGHHLCFTGEGRLDGQSMSGKACLGVAAAAKQQGVETVALVGAVGLEVDRTLKAGLSAVVVIGAGLPPEESMRRAGGLVTHAATQVVCQRRLR